MKKILPLITLLFVTLSAAAQQINTAKLDSLFGLLEKNNKTMGSFAIAKEGKVVYRRSIGFSDSKDGKLVAANDKTKYRIGSVTKMYTAAMIFQLVDEGKLSLETKVSKYYPQIPNADKMTIEMLLNHKNGLYDFVNDGDEMWITKSYTKQEILGKIGNNPPHFAPGESESYSNSGYLIAAYIIEDVTGKPYNQNLQKRICKKLGLKNTYSPSNNTLKENEAASFGFDNGWNEITDIYFPNVVGVGDILATPQDLIIFNEALIAGKLFSPKCLQIMKTIRPSTFGTGIMQVPFYDKNGFGHGGGTFGTSTIVATYPDDKLTVAFSINGEVYPQNDITIAMLEIAYGKNYNFPVFIDIPVEVLDKYAGVYSSPAFPLKLTITREKNTIIGQATGQSAFPLKATAGNIFTFDAAGIVIEFDTEKSQLVIKQGKYINTLTKE